MWKRHSIAAKKAAGDQKKAQNYSKIWKVIQLAAKKGTDPKMNPELELALQKARYYNLPRDVIDKAIKKGSGELKWEDLKEIIYEAYWPWGTALIIKALTDNVNRTAGNIRIILQKNQASLWEPGSVNWQFKQTWVIVINWVCHRYVDKWNDVTDVNPFEQEKLEEEMFSLDISDLEFEDSVAIVYTSLESFNTVKADILALNYNIVEANLEYIADNTVSPWDEDKQRLEIILDMLEEDEDIDSVFHNME